MIRAVIIVALAASYAALATAAAAKKHGATKQTVQKCDPPKRWIEIPALADDAGDPPQKRVCK